MRSGNEEEFKTSCGWMENDGEDFQLLFISADLNPQSTPGSPTLLGSLLVFMLS